MGPRYAIYYAPDPGSPLWQFGSAVIGYDAATGLDAPFPPGEPFDATDWRRLTEEPRRYGFHATLAAPFHLADGATEEELLRTARHVASGRAAIAVPELRVEALGAFVALVPAEPTPGLGALAADCVRGFGPLRAPLSPADRARRLAAPLTDRQIRHLEAWGYPFVFEDYRFHMTLSGALPAQRRTADRAALERAYAAVPPGISVDALTVFRQGDRADRFRVWARCPFGG